MAFCTSCGQQVNDSQQFCGVCGAAIQTSTTQASTTSRRSHGRAQRKPATTAQKATGCGCLVVVIIFVGIVVAGIVNAPASSPSSPTPPADVATFGPSADQTSCAVSEVIPTKPPVGITLVIQSDTLSPSRTCSKPLPSGSSWADPSAPGLTQVCTTDDGNETSHTYTNGSDTGAVGLAKSICDTMHSQGATVTYP